MPRTEQTTRQPGSPGDHIVYREIRDAILDHRLPPGRKLTEDALGEVFGVSRTIVRTALSRLAHDKVVELRRNRGAVVASPSVDEAREVFDARRALEREGLRRISGRLGPADLDSLRALVAAERRAHGQGDRRAWIRLSGEFHLRLATLAGNAVLAGFLRELVSRTSLIIALYESPGRATCSFDEHLALLDALADGDTRRAVRLMDAHLETCESRLRLEDTTPDTDLSEVFAARTGSVGEAGA